MGRTALLLMLPIDRLLIYTLATANKWLAENLRLLHCVPNKTLRLFLDRLWTFFTPWPVSFFCTWTLASFWGPHLEIKRLFVPRGVVWGHFLK